MPARSRHAALALIIAALTLPTTHAAWADPAPNHVPTAMDFRWTLAKDTLLTVPAPGLLEGANDADGDHLEPAITDSPQHGMLVNPVRDGSFGYLPEPGFLGVDRFHYVVDDGHGGRSPNHLVTILVGPMPVTAAPDHYRAGPDGTLTVAAPGVLGNDHDAAGDPLTSALEARPEHGRWNWARTGASATRPGRASPAPTRSATPPPARRTRRTGP